MMETSSDIEAKDSFEKHYTGFLETVSQLRPRLHRYCARMTGSILDGEDVVQDAVFEAYRNLHRFDARRSQRVERAGHDLVAQVRRLGDTARDGKVAARALRATHGVA